MRTFEEIIKRIEEIEDPMSFGFEKYDLIEFLPFEHAKKFLDSTVTEDNWKPNNYTIDVVVDIIKDYLPFAFEKALYKRGLSASRSMDHMRAWLWLACEDDLLKKLDYLHYYTDYGLSNLHRIKDHYGIEVDTSYINSDSDDDNINNN